jgi:apolipoprotein N-acyltransferase
MRALENSRWLLRATNDGITSIIDPAGRVVASLPSFEKGVLCGKFNYRSELTWFARFGEWFWWLCCGAAVALLLLARRFTV